MDHSRANAIEITRGGNVTWGHDCQNQPARPCQTQAEATRHSHLGKASQRQPELPQPEPARSSQRRTEQGGTKQSQLERAKQTDSQTDNTLKGETDAWETRETTFAFDGWSLDSKHVTKGFVLLLRLQDSKAALYCTKTYR